MPAFPLRALPPAQTWIRAFRFPQLSRLPRFSRRTTSYLLVLTQIVFTLFNTLALWGNPWKYSKAFLIAQIPFPKSFPGQLLLRIQDVWINLLMHWHPEVAHENVPQSYFNRGSQAGRLPLQTSSSRFFRPSHLPDATAPLSPSSRKLSEMHF